MKQQDEKSGRSFELAVHDFAQTLSPSAEVIFNHKVLDRDTGTLRQCDVWINTQVGGHWPLSILVSCKDHNRKLHVGDIGAFTDEIRSTGASTGVIYSRRGFTKPALQKAKANGIACCRLYLNERTDIPAAIAFDQYTCNPYFRLALIENPDPGRFRTWNDLFSVKVEDNGTKRELIDVIQDTYLEGQASSMAEGAAKDRFPADWAITVTIDGEEVEGRLRFNLLGGWNRFRARVEAHLLDGSYSVNNSCFRGSITGPSIDTKSPNPGDGWTRVESDSLALPSNRLLMILTLTAVRESLRELIGPELLPRLNDEKAQPERESDA